MTFVKPDYDGGPHDKWMFREVLGIPFFRFDMGYSNRDKVEEIFKILPVSYTHLTLPTTPYV